MITNQRDNCQRLWYSSVPLVLQCLIHQYNLPCIATSSELHNLNLTGKKNIMQHSRILHHRCNPGNMGSLRYLITFIHPIGNQKVSVFMLIIVVSCLRSEALFPMQSTIKAYWTDQRRFIVCSETHKQKSIPVCVTQLEINHHRVHP